jgi:hypothetical protein
LASSDIFSGVHGGSNVNSSGGFLERPTEEYLIRARGRVNSLEDLANSVVTGAKNGYGIQLYPSSNHVVIANNTIVGNQSGIIVGGQGELATTKALVVNNIVAFNDKFGITTFWGDGSHGRDNFAVNNLGYGNGDSSFDSSEGGGISYQKNFTRDPRFVNRAARNFHLRSTSGAIDRALGSSTEVDFDGGASPGPPGRRGAFERLDEQRFRPAARAARPNSVDRRA